MDPNHSFDTSCFKRSFILYLIETKRGDVLDENGKVVGTHIGAIFYTIGEHYMGYVIAKDLEKNTITVSKKKPEEVIQEKTVTL